ncbi:PLP-dependent aminotransferase family protein [Umezawaea endophytica]|uniref:PLP-dependent aminotransferase family protein n=1 Tax=Umezawaea endophytica TaxID=1654476 RepID=A0A9X3A670_9PSEU|nr:PLP-dependent aminotransferase family protein [Umezawaea endophytica]MCS7483073.1 PLP-dependent aminotransferase family protein [Umezawaea endophytica]
MDQGIPLGGRISGQRLARLLGDWRRRGARQGAADLASGIRMLVLEGQLPAGTRLPSEREIADVLPVSRTMITAALDQLREDGVVASRRGAGSWITLPTGALSPAVDLAPSSRSQIDLARAAPPAVPAMAAAMEAVRLRMPEHLAGHGYHEHGVLDLRRRIADRYTARGLPTSPEHIVITSGAQHAIALALRLFTGPGDRVLVEQPSYPNALDAIRSVSAIPVPVPLLPDGWDLAGIAAALRQAAPRVAYLVLDFHNPTGHRLDDQGRARLGELLRRARTPAIIDESLVDLDLDGDPADAPRPMAAYADELVVTIGSASKSHWGGMRVGWIRARPDVVHRLVSARTAIDLGTAVYEQLVMAELLTDPESVLRARRAELVVQRDVLVESVREHCPRWTFRRPGGGLVLWCELDAPISTQIAVVAQSHGLRLVPGSRFAAQGGLERWLRLPYGLPVDVLREAARRLGAVADLVAGSTAAVDGDLAVPVA